MKRTLVWLLMVAACVASEITLEAWGEEKDFKDSEKEIENNKEYVHERKTREVEEQEVAAAERCENDRLRSPTEELVRKPRQVHQYEVHEFHDESEMPSVPYEEMLAASAEHYHKVYPSPGAKAARYLNADVSHNPNNLAVNVVPSNLPPKPVPFQAPLNAPTPLLNNPAASLVTPLNVPNPLHINSALGSGQGFVNVPTGALQQQAQSADQYPAAGHHQVKHHGGHGHSQGGGHGHQAHHHNEHGVKSSSGFKKDQHIDKGGKGFKKDENHRKEYEEAAGKRSKHRDLAGHQGNHEEEAHGHRGSNFEEKKGHKKGHKTKGYHNKYHKDEFHKEHKFYDDYHKSGEHHRYGKFNAKHASNESGKKKAHHVNAGHDFVERGKKGYSNKGHVDADHKGHNGKRGHEEYHENHSQHGRKGGKEGGSHWGHSKKN